MSGNLEQVLNLIDSLPTLLKQPVQNMAGGGGSNGGGGKEEEDDFENKNIFELISQLNTENFVDVNNKKNMLLSSTPTESKSYIDKTDPKVGSISLMVNSIEAIQVSNDEDYQDENECNSTESSGFEANNYDQETSNSPSESEPTYLPDNKLSQTGEKNYRTRIPIGIPMARPVTNIIQKSLPTSNTLSTKIPRIAIFTKPRQENQENSFNSCQNFNKESSFSSSSTSSSNDTSCLNRSQAKTTTNNGNALPKPRVVRSISRDVSCSQTGMEHLINVSTTNQTKLKTPQPKSVEATKSIAKRGSSLSTALSSSSIGSLSKNEPNLEKNKKNVRYIVKHKPRETKVKIFSKKLELKNISSKIGSLDNADHKPSGGTVVIETKALNWNAQAKIGSLEKASYTPCGGNVKIESHKLNWNAQSKIGSLEKANYQPQGGNVKIENHRLNFKEKARPKTDTGLIVIEGNDYLDNSQCVSIENLNETQDFSS